MSMYQNPNAMRSLLTRSLLMLAVMLTFTAAHATMPPAGETRLADPLRAKLPSAQERELKKQINRFVTYPLLERKREMDGEVRVSFVINAAGKVEVITATSD